MVRIPRCHILSPFSPVIPVFAQWLMVAKTQVMRGSALRAFICQVCYAYSQQQRPTVNPQYGTIPQGEQPAPW